MRSVELFAGAGGLALGTALAGFRHDVVVEHDGNACETIRENQRRGYDPVAHWTLYQSDARTFDYSAIRAPIDVLVAGPPCQPFSLGGKHRSIDDDRNMFPEVARAARELKPRAILVENVKGLLRSTFAAHFEYILLQLSYPELSRRSGENWTSHLTRLERYKTGGRHDGLCYQTVFRLMDSAEHGVPQRRHRVFIVGFRSDQKREWAFPNATHSLDSLLWSQYVSGDYWERHRVARRERPSVPDKYEKRVERMRQELFRPTLEPSLTVRDAIADLPDPRHPGSNFFNHRYQPGARAYHGHNGSPWDWPAKALKAGDHGVPGGENMVANRDGSVRYFTVRESARLQHFPDEYVFRGSWTESMRQIGNAVPVTLAKVVGESVRAGLRP